MKTALACASGYFHHELLASLDSRIKCMECWRESKAGSPRLRNRFGISSRFRPHRACLGGASDSALGPTGSACAVPTELASVEHMILHYKRRSQRPITRSTEASSAGAGQARRCYVSAKSLLPPRQARWGGCRIREIISAPFLSLDSARISQSLPPVQPITIVRIR